MCEIRLIKPTMAYEADILKFRQEIEEAKDADSFAGCSDLETYTSIEDWIKYIAILEDEKTCPKDRVPSNVYLAVRKFDNKIVGVIDFRHHIHHPILGLWGGHIGYSVRPNERKKGYAKEMLKQVLQICRKHALSKVMITCHPGNVGSERTILANGGIFEKEICVDDTRVNRYWIDL